MKKTRVLMIILVGLTLVLGAVYFWLRPAPANNPSSSGLVPSTHQSAANHGKNSQLATVKHIFIIMDENQPSNLIIGNSADAPYINSLISKYAVATNYSAVSNPSLPNYLAITSGSTDGTTTDCNPPGAGCIVNVPNIADEIEHSGRTWKEYAESMPQPCYILNYGNYATKHNPFIYYADIVNDKSRCDAHVVPYTELQTDLRSPSTTPDFAFITPDLCDDMHNCSIETGDYWLSQNVPMILNSKAFTSTSSLLIITWDEGSSSYNNVAAILAGSAAKNGYVTDQAYSHYSVLRTIETLWNLQPLTINDKSASAMTGMIR